MGETTGVDPSLKEFEPYNQRLDEASKAFYKVQRAVIEELHSTPATQDETRLLILNRVMLLAASMQSGAERLAMLCVKYAANEASQE